MLYFSILVVLIANAVLAWRIAHTTRTRVIAFSVYTLIFAVLMLVMNLVVVGADRLLAFDLTRANYVTLIVGLNMFWLVAVLGVFWRIRRLGR